MTAETVLHLLGRARPVARALLDGVAHRARLAQAELDELRERAIVAVLVGMAAWTLAALAGMAAVFAFAAAVWAREDRVLWLALLALCCLGGAVALIAVMLRRVAELRFLPETARQLDEDRLCLGALLKDGKDTGAS